MDEFYSIGGAEYFSKGISIIEWGELIKDALPKEYIEVTFSKDDTMFVQATAYKNGPAFTPFAHYKRYFWTVYTFNHEEGIKFFNIADEIKVQSDSSI